LSARRGQSGIVYCLSRRKVEETAQFLCQEGYSALAYHAGMTSSVRTANQRRFIHEEGVVICATIAFGMGIDKPDVRFVAHLDLPKSVEGYYQETGRAGRDGEPAEAWMCYGFADVATLISMIDGSEAGEERKRLERRKLEALLGYAETTHCRRQVLLANFGETLSQACGNCDNCLDPPETWDGTVASQKALSCVYRTGQRFGVAYVIDVLRGTPNLRISQFGHDRQSTFGIGADMDLNTWRSVFRQLVAAGFLDVDVQGYGGLRLRESARALLRGETRVQLRRDLRRTRKQSSPRGETRSQTRPGGDIEVSRSAQPRYDALRELRTQLAREQNVPAYMIFSNATLRDIAEEDPNELDELATISGVGVAKLERYGEAVLEALALIR
jgi:ATP-dependent DNA helicase RecQ